MRWLAAGEADLPPGEGWLADAERERLAGMHFTKRRVDYLLGRFVAKRAVARSLDLPQDPASLRGIEVGNDEEGAPFARAGGAPAPLSISISDRAGWGICALGPAGLALGCDLELIEPRGDAFVADMLTEAERARVAAAADEEERQRLANLIWCAKESALKVLRTGLRRDTRSVEVTLGEAPGTEGWQPLRVDRAEGGAFPGWWRAFGAFLVSVAADAEIAPPLALEEPPALAGAQPSHSWLAEPVDGSATALRRRSNSRSIPSTRS